MRARTAAQAYRDQIATVRSNLRALTEALEKHIAETGDRPHWGHVGDLSHLNEWLSIGRRFIRQEED